MEFDGVREEVKEHQSLQKRYELIYSETYSTSFPGIHSCIVDAIRPELAGKRVLDLGCGAGRLSLAASLYADEVLGVDFSEKAIAVARQFQDLTDRRNVTFEVVTSTGFPEGRFDYILISEVIEHVPDPLATFKQAAEHLSPQGAVVVSCPAFENFRGYIYMTCMKYLGYPMSLTDKRWVTVPDVTEWAKSAGLVLSGMIGTLYEWAWLQHALDDMERRVRLAGSDAVKMHGPLPFEDHGGLIKWMSSLLPFHQEVIDAWVEKGELKLRESAFNLKCPSAAPERARTYLEDGPLSANRFYSDQFPVNTLGGDRIYLLRKE